MRISKHISTLTNALIASFCILMAFPSMATPTTTDKLISHYFAGDNDCNNPYFQDPGSNSFSTCKVAIGTFDVDKVYLADVIAKFDTIKDSTSPSYTESDNYAADIEQADWTFGNNGGELDSDYKVGTWTYTGGSPGIRFWTAKAGNGFNLFWLVDDTTDANNACNPETYTLACLNLAKTVTSGSWTTPVGTNGKNKGLSHLTFFGGTITTCQQNCSPIVVPEPQTIMLFALAMLGFVVRRERSTIKQS
ncbi:PEP-CTERM sorting domain-containing protein [Colwellia sp. M166]|jgi:hypothetical protein|uniref:PEP-CTERM sorting domain-containing protein n=1 Tax=Colwellia sp. M166 TaxID=2583805 RepID=UPI00211E2A2B|nr:PEP-CTERM sorting domain-containing protein [Colwellia sp. M166]UUO25176.1 PEP-CTERM sorting domain-containing protein [Colwellia sp. M166]|tara:strand:- start:5074 stop:5820 length:747 start_codon:yes stop_codon:yes gene_type:complete